MRIDDHLKAKARKYYHSHAEERRAYARKYRADHPHMKRIRKQWVSDNSRRSHLKRQYGMIQKEYEEMLEKQNHKCSICATHIDNPCVDHDHKTGKVRGLLCRTCNSGLGHFKDNERILVSAAEYLRRHQ